MGKKVTLAIQVDALRYDYINESNSAFVWTLKKEGISGSLIPTFGFEPDAAYLAGLYPEECNGGMHYWYSPQTSPFKFTRIWLGWLEYLSRSLQGRGLSGLPELVARRVVRWIAQRNSPYSAICCQASTARIPLNLLHYFDFSTKYLPFEEGFVLGRKTVFDILRENKEFWFFHGHPSQRVNSESVLRRVKSELRPPCTLAFLHIGDLDRVGHKYGPNSLECKETLRKVDTHIAKIYELARERFKEVHLLIFGDHGMAEVREKIDIWSRVKKLDLNIGKDYVFFLDSTMARFWFIKEKAREQILSLLEGFKEGHFLSGQEKKQYHINYPHNKFGEFIFLTNPQIVIFPNFFQNCQPPKGMHGYTPEFRDQHSAFLIHSSCIKAPKTFEEPVDMRRIFPTILDLLGVDIPKTCRVQGLL